jgi:hypothetical protein
MKSVKITEEVHRLLKIAAAERGSTLSEMLEAIAVLWLTLNTRCVEGVK